MPTSLLTKWSGVGDAGHIGTGGRSEIGRAATRYINGASRQHFSRAEELAAEQREIAERAKRDGRRSSRDDDRLREIDLERRTLREELEAAKASEASADLKEAATELVSAPVSDDETSAAVGILSSRVCPSCGGSMRIRQGGYNGTSRRRSFYWLCSARPGACPTIHFDPAKEKLMALRKSDPNLDLPTKERRAIWERKDVVRETQIRLRQHLGDKDDEVICPHHLLPMKLLEQPSSNGLLLSTYQYVCLHVDDDGRACQHRIPLETFPQVSETLRRTEGAGIIH
ncbi:zinc ribbon domain-containing protein [Thauera aromatica]|uniref:zinc ribbon domain-containing protein n=1 Tax=Thauera aromatica TaxID=59405 RepID=UPI001FFDC29E|nr:zinc ribbon domain-containing protein [Thauera aromatica]MCK2097354.1 zinc ribbon domain-containing protein [Thauera aromatica]